MIKYTVAVTGGALITLAVMCAIHFGSIANVSRMVG